MLQAADIGFFLFHVRPFSACGVSVANDAKHPRPETSSPSTVAAFQPSCLSDAVKVIISHGHTVRLDFSQGLAVLLGAAPLPDYQQPKTSMPIFPMSKRQ